jgi:putative hydroxymethylpyrimidine transport system substrate-binding protein
VRRIPLLIVVLAALAGCGGGSSAPPTIALDFQPNAVHAGIYAARDVRVRVPSSSTDSLKLLAAGRADLAVVDIHDLGLARERGADIVGVGALVQRPLAAVIANPGIRRPRELEGKRVGVTGLPSDDAVLRAVVEHDGGDYSKVRRTTIGFTAVPSLIAGKVDAVVAFWNAEGVALRERGVATREFRVDDYGAPRYPELVLATKEADAAEAVDTLAKLEAGTRRALRDRHATIDRLVRASGADEQLMRAQLDAVARALVPPMWLDRAALAGWARFDARFGILPRPPDVDEAFPRP